MPFPRSRLALAFGCVLSAAAAVPAAVGDWMSYSDLGTPTAFATWHGQLFVGTGGGVRRMDPVPPFRETDYNNMQGLVDVRIVAFAVDPEDRLWAGSRSGQLYRLEGENWSAWGKSYASAGWTLSSRAMAAAGRYLILGSDKGLSFFDRKTGLAAANLAKFANLGRQSVTSVLPSGDTLYIVAGGTVLRARIDWNDVNSGKFGGSVFDPSIWTPAANLGTLPDWARKTEKDSAAGAETTADSTSDSTTAAADSAAAKSVELSRLGKALVVHAAGTLLDSPHRVVALKGQQTFVDGDTYGDLNTEEAAALAGDQVFLGGRQGLWFYHEGNFGIIPPPGPLPSAVDKGVEGRVTSVSARGGKAMLMSGYGIFSFEKGRAEQVVDYPVSPEISSLELRSLAFLDDGGVVYGSWGGGFGRSLADGTKKRWSNANSCLFAVESGDYTVVQTMSDPRGSDVWMTVLENAKGDPPNLMAHFDLASNTLSCPEVKGDNNYTYSTRILSDTLFAVVGDRTMRVYRYGIGGVKSNIEAFGQVTGGNGTDEGKDMQMDGYGRLWALMNGRIGYVDSLGDKVGAGKKLPVAYLDGFSGENCTMLETDARQGLWAGCENGVFRLTPGVQPELTGIEHYTINDGLLSDRIIDLSADPKTGEIWAVTEQGVSIFRSTAQPVLSGVSGVKAYPNPFRARHRMVVIDNVPKGATGGIFTQSGDAVRRFDSGDMRGNQFQWDGTNAAGRKVTPGIYFYSVSAGGKTSRGKLIVAR